MSRCLSCLVAIVLAGSGNVLMARNTPSITLEDVQSALPELDKLAQRTLEETGVPGMAIAVVYQDEVVFLKGFGVRQAGRDDLPVDEDTLFQLASVSKPIASTVIAACVGEGIVGWDDRIVDYLPDFQLSDPWITREVRIRDMLCHRSGLPDHAGDLLEDIGFNRNQVLHQLRYLDDLGKFRADYAYTNFGYTTAGEATARAAGSAWEELSEQKLYDPAGMRSTSSRFADFQSAPNRALTHVRVDGQWVARFVRQPDAQSPAGGVSSNARDMAVYLRLQLAQGKLVDHRIVDPRALAETHSPQIVSGVNPQTLQASLYGLGWNVGTNPLGQHTVSHSGAFALGMRSQISLVPDEGLGIVVLSNAAPTGIPEGITMSFFELVSRGELSRDWVAAAGEMMAGTFEPAYTSNYTQWPRNETPPSNANSYVGTYGNDYFGDLMVSVDQQGLLISLGPEPRHFRLTHWDRDVFVYQPSGENAGGLASVTFTMSADGAATRVTLQNLDVDRPGTFVRRP